MPGNRGFAISLASFVAAEMMGCVPPARGHVDASAEGQNVVDHDNLLMMTRSSRMLAVEPEMNLRLGLHFQEQV